MRKLLLFLTLVITHAQAQEKLNLMPWPTAVNQLESRFRIDDSFKLNIDGAVGKNSIDYASRFISRLSGRTGIFFTDFLPVENPLDSGLQISIAEEKSLEVGVDESYELKISGASINLLAKTQVGAMRGLETLLQLLSADEKGYYFIGAEVNDAPRFVWRGLLLDVCRHWMPMDVVLRNLDAMAAVKMNVLHLHLTEDQGFRVESKVYPKLHQLGSDGNYFTQEDIKLIVSYAAARGIRVIPEFDIPAHTSSWFVGYPELASASGPYTITRKAGVQDPTIDPTKESTYKFLKGFLTEMAGLFPDTYMHIGGDENNGKQWDANPQISKFKEENGFVSNHELQAYFNMRIAKILTSLNKRMVGWDEILDKDLPKSIVIQSWRGKQALVDAAEAGYDVLLSNGYYIDLSQPASYHYLNDPIPENTELSSEARKHVLGGEATMWSEKVSPETVDSRIWPRTAAIAERLWSPANINDINSMHQRMGVISAQLEEHGVTHLKNYEMMMRRLVGQENVPVLKILIDVLEPVEGYARGRYKKYTMQSPLTRVPDIARPDAIVAREFNLLVDKYLKNKNANLKNDIKEQLLIWIDNSKKIKKLAEVKPEIREILPLSDDLSKISIIAMQALSPNKFHDASWHKSASSMLAEAAKPKAECELKVIEGISKLVSATK
ncbi:MAG: beta-hexosaminidase [Bacteroidetes bacterium]|nr:MAG: beta-hexosaminidase [Bacteroidota bacterium]